ncbi:MAG: mechanosensitive ion channel family protein [Acidimicrobiia bacterium]|nr:mechanosensitive ion channel family protein [Acidimicrobiia bacterium]
MSKLLARIAAALVFVFGFLYAIQQVGVSLGPLLGLLGLFGLAFAFAFQEVLENFIAGFFLSARRPFAQGDEITTSDYEGKVEDISLRELTLRTYDGELVYVPNSSVWSNPIVNHTALDRRRTTLQVGVGYDSNLKEVADLLLKTMEDVDGVAADPAPQAYAHAFGGSSIDFALRFWHESGIAEEWRVRDAVLKAVHVALTDAGVDIPFPQRVLTVAGETIEELAAARAASA